ncbi:acyl-CoA dehydrogenase family protein [Kitasatospora sp. NPDC018619]|uniref:acyl-CoA dehydrogenase family protein n=1 Tax=unclassified Kitasatospora TaxID=2633591 RepID=UPI0037AF909F
MLRYAPHLVTERFEELLGDPNDTARTFSLARCVELDEREEFPAEICRELDAAGVPGYYVPARHGGELRSFEELFQVFRVVARRDLTAAIAHHKTFLGAVSAWVAGEPGQADRLAADVLAGGVVSWALTEAAHGSDLLAGEVRAEPTPGGYRLTGEKWLINNATRADQVCVLAATDPQGGARGFTLLLADKRTLAEGDYHCLPAVRTHGVRGADISGIGFDGAELPASAVVGTPGAGLEIVLKGFQLTRTLCAALTLGAVDRGLRTALGFALEHRLYGRPVAELPQSRRMLTESYADQLVGEAVGLFASRSIHALPGELGTTSAVAKYLVPTIGDEVLTRLGQLLGARAYLRNSFAHGVYQKVERDHRIVGIFDGSTVVNLNALVTQFAFLARGYRDRAVDAEGLRTAADLTAAVPEFDPQRLQLVPRSGASAVNALPGAADRIAELAAAGRVGERLAALVAEVRAFADEVHRRMELHRPSARATPADAFDLAERYTVLHAAAACLHLWLANRETAAAATAPDAGPDTAAGTAAATRTDTTAAPDPAAGLWRGALWLEACLTRLLDRLRPAGATDRGAVLDELFPALHAQYRGGLLFSPLSCRLAEETAV